jgi:hypothetical protein
LITVTLDATTVIARGDTSINYIDSLKLTAQAEDKNGNTAKLVWALDGKDFNDTGGY